MLNFRKVAILVLVWALLLTPMFADAQNIKLPNPFKCNQAAGGCTLYGFIQTLINDILLPLGGVVVVVMLIYAGFLFVTAGGNEAQLKRARSNFLWVVVGTAILLGAWVIAKVIENTVKQLRA